MADADEIAKFRRMADLEDDDTVYSDTLIDGMIEDLGFPTAVATVWREKAAAAASLVDTTESGSSRRLSGLRSAYLDMADKIDPPAIDGVAGKSFTVEIERV